MLLLIKVTATVGNFALPCVTRSDFKSRLSSLADMVNTFAIFAALLGTVDLTFKNHPFTASIRTVRAVA